MKKIRIFFNCSVIFTKNHKSPIRANIVMAIREYPLTSHQGYVSNAKKWNWLHKRFLLGMFSKRLSVAGKMYREFVADEDSLEILSFFGKKNLASLFGSADFIQWVKEMKHDEVPESRVLSTSIAEIKRLSAMRTVLMSRLFCRQDVAIKMSQELCLLIGILPGRFLEVHNGTGAYEKKDTVNVVITYKIPTNAKWKCAQVLQ